jgi:hypothetical protein
MTTYDHIQELRAELATIAAELDVAWAELAKEETALDAVFEPPH